MHRKYDHGVPSCPQNFEDFTICSSTTESQKDSPVNQTQLKKAKGPKVHPIGYGGIHKREKKETRQEGVQEPSTTTMHVERVRHTFGQMDRRQGLQAQSRF